MILDIETGSTNDVLRTKSLKIEKIDSSIKKLARDMKATIGPASGMGLAAPQVGENLRMILIKIPSEYYQSTGFDLCKLDQNMILINPEIINSSEDHCIMEEGCLSLPDYFAEVIRPCGVEFRAIDEKGNNIGGKVSGIFARILQHEIDHLEGVLFEDKVVDRKQKQKYKIYI